MKELELKDLYDGSFYHVCTNGLEENVIIKDDEDYRIALNYLAITSLKTGVFLICYCLMSNHFHFLIACPDKTEALSFIRYYKKLYSTYLHSKYGTKAALHGVEDSISQIDTLRYLQNCIAYILRNPVAARVCARIEDYKWSSIDCYFRDKGTSRLHRLSEFSERKKRLILRSHGFPQLNDLYIDDRGCIANQSFVRGHIVERAFWNSGRAFLNGLGRCNDVQMEYELVCRPLLGVNDAEMNRVVEGLVRARYPGKQIQDLSVASRCNLVKHIYFGNKTTVPQLARVLGLSRELVRKVLLS
ncbi:MAG: transposase [Bacteroidales bacterium]|nr:transposase [Bacteroidales bacterium]